MDAEFWHERWKNRELGFHEGRPNGLLVQHCARLSLKAASRVFLPLCGKTLDIAWLRSRGFRICGVELNADAVDQLFQELGLQPEIRDCGDLRHHSADSIDIFVGDIFALSAPVLGTVDAIYDRAALVALPEETRRRYTEHMRAISGSPPQLLICFEYDQALMAGPPFSISESEVVRLYGADHTIEKLSVVEVPGGLKGKYPAKEVAWLLHKK